MKLRWNRDKKLSGWVDLYADGEYTEYSYKRTLAGEIITVTPHGVDEPEFGSIEDARAWLTAMYVLRTVG